MYQPLFLSTPSALARIAKVTAFLEIYVADLLEEKYRADIAMQIRVFFLAGYYKRAVLWLEVTPSVLAGL